MTLLRRALAGAAATTLLAGALVAGTATPAAAYPSQLCPEAGSTRLFTANDGQYKWWLYQPNQQTLHLCFADGLVTSGRLEITTGMSGTLVPVVTPNASDPTCANFLNIQDPVDLATRLQAHVFQNPMDICVGVGDRNVGVTVQTGTGTLSPDVSLYLDSWTWGAQLVCSVFPCAVAPDETYVVL